MVLEVNWILLEIAMYCLKLEFLTHIRLEEKLSISILLTFIYVIFLKYHNYINM